MSAGKNAAAALILLLGWVGSAQAASEEFAEDRLEKETLINDARDAIQVQVSPDGDVYVIERMGALRRYSLRDRTTQALGSVPTTVIAEGGLIGFALTPDFVQSRQLYLLYSRSAGVTSKQPVMRLVRMALVDDRLDRSSERVQHSLPVLAPFTPPSEHHERSLDPVARPEPLRVIRRRDIEPGTDHFEVGEARMD